MTSYDTDELRSLGQQVYDAINAQDLVALEQLFAPDVVRHAMGQVGFDAARTAVTSMFESRSRHPLPRRGPRGRGRPGRPAGHRAAG
jgi:hypothetical protein